MLDIHALTITPGAATTLGSAGTISANDFAAVAGVPLRADAIMIAWGYLSIAADTIANMRCVSQDMIDPINAEQELLGTSSTKVGSYLLTKLPYKTGARIITAGTNTGVTGGNGFTLDYYSFGTVIAGSRFMPMTIKISQTLSTDVAQTWTATAFAPTTAIPNGKYAILGFWLTKTTAYHLIRFQHADFGQFFPGIPTQDAAVGNMALGSEDDLTVSPGYQFVKLSEITGTPQCPVFTVSNAGTGLNIISLAAANTDTPVIIMNIAKVG